MLGAEGDVGVFVRDSLPFSFSVGLYIGLLLVLVLGLGPQSRYPGAETWSNADAEQVAPVPFAC